MEIQGLKAIIIGGASGFARATAERIATGGGSVAILDREGSRGRGGRRTARRHVAPDECARLRGDRRSDRRGGRGARWTARRGRTPLVAARRVERSGADGPFDLDDFRAVIDLNLIATFNIEPPLRPPTWPTNEPNDDGERWRDHQHGVDRRVRGPDRPGRVHRAKAGIAGMTLTMARDLGSLGIRVNAIAPSLFATGAHRRHHRGVRGASLTKDAAFPKRLGQARRVRPARRRNHREPDAQRRHASASTPAQRFAPK